MNIVSILGAAVRFLGPGCGGVLAALAKSRRLGTVRNIPFLRWFGKYPAAAPENRQTPTPGGCSQDTGTGQQCIDSAF